MSIRAATRDDIPHIKRLAIDTEMFPPEEASFVDEMVPGSLDGSLPDDVWLVHETAGRVTGAAYYAPEPNAQAIFNVFFISVEPVAQGQGIGGSLMRHIEAALVGTARVLLVETSSTEKYARTREFYPKLGYVEEARIREYYGPGDDKVVFWKQVSGV